MSLPPTVDNTILRAYRAELRSARIAAREALPPARRAAATHAVAQALATLLARLQPRVVGFCWPHRGEVDVREAIAQWLAHDTQRRAALPLVVAPRAPMHFRAWHPGAAMVIDRLGIETPAHGETLLPDCLLLPLVAFDAAGYRLGYGAGYFDRTIAAASPRPLCIGVGFELARCDTIQPQPHDAPLDYLVSEAGCTSFVRDTAAG